eukprot:gnl/TRDRNA2_/TRDRNA2_32973_c0_seq1.p1 gnl/TRDRNA2_/TRDRNA2_32973_c0~~gnl/TRDRNA2_/TRDRNA2_32973_c0_seq1.p1  ORF type:complete len:120 (+),score=21.49 gnl/TRDRNA2_/TRDRNA2_32973_c0_seq1:633-992(+)
MKHTDPINSGKYIDHFEAGTYSCSACSLPLYFSMHKFRSGHGWPAFSDSIPGALSRRGKGKVEITCKDCGAHVGHVFKSSRYPAPTHERHCVNSTSLTFMPSAAGKASAEKNQKKQQES